MNTRASIVPPLVALLCAISSCDSALQDEQLHLEGVTLPAAPSKVAWGFTLVHSGTTTEMADTLLASREWTEGWDTSQGWGVWIYSSWIDAPDPAGLPMAIREVQLEGKFQFADYLAGVVERSVMGAIDGPVDKQRARLERYDALSKTTVSDPLAANVRDLIAQALSRGGSREAMQGQIAEASRVVAQAVIPSMLPMHTYVQASPEGARGLVSVVLVSTPASRALMSAVLARDMPPGDNLGIPPIGWLWSLSHEACMYGCGPPYIIDKRGELCLLGYGVGLSTTHHARHHDRAAREAHIAAAQDVRWIVSELIAGSQLRSKARDMKVLLDGGIASETVATMRTNMSVIGDGLALFGIMTVYETRDHHPPLGSVRCTVGAYSLSELRRANARELR